MAQVDKLSEDEAYDLVVEVVMGHIVLWHPEMDSQEIFDRMMEIGYELEATTNKDLIAIREDLYDLIWDTTTQLEKRIKEEAISNENFLKPDIKQVCVHDGEIWIITIDGVIMKWEEPRWQKYIGRSDQICIQTKKNVHVLWSIDNHTVYQYDGPYNRRIFDGSFVYISITEEHIMAIDEELLLWTRKKVWESLNIRAIQVSINEAGNVWCIDEYNRAWRLVTDVKEWKMMKLQVTQVHVGQNQVLLLGEDGFVTSWSAPTKQSEVWKVLPLTEPLQYVTQDNNKIWGITRQNKLYHE
jgi:hypothetical protein